MPGYSERRVAICLRCKNEWHPMVTRPATCPRCRRADWDVPAPAPPEPPKPPLPLSVHQLTFRSEYKAFMARQGERDARAVAEYLERKGERRYTADEVDVRPPMMDDGIPMVLGRLTLTRRKHRRKAE